MFSAQHNSSIAREALHGFDGFMFSLLKLLRIRPAFTLGVRANVQPPKSSIPIAAKVEISPPRALH
jgi:hypothetical protein